MVDVNYGEEKDFTLSDPDGYVSLGYLNFKPGGSKTPITGMVKLNKELPGGGAVLRLLIQVYDENNKLVGEFPNLIIPQIQPGEIKGLFGYATKPIDSTATKYSFEVHVSTETGPSRSEGEQQPEKGTQGTKIKAIGSVDLTDNEAKDILKELIPKAAGVYAMFNGSVWFAEDATKTIPGEKEYSLVTGETRKTELNTKNLKSIAELKKVVEDVFTIDMAQKLFYSGYLESKDIGLPLYKEYEGRLYVNTNNGGHGSATKYFIDTAKIISQEGNVVVVEFNTTEYDYPYKMTVKIEKVNGKWLLASGASFNNEVEIKYDYILKYQGEGSLWSAALEDTVWDFGNGKNKVYSRIVLTYKGSDIKKVGKVDFTYGSEANRNKGTFIGTNYSDGIIIFDEFDDNIVLPANDDVVKVTVEWDGKQDSFVMSNSGQNNLTILENQPNITQ